MWKEDVNPHKKNILIFFPMSASPQSREDEKNMTAETLNFGPEW